MIVDDTLAYITLRTGTNCGGNLNILDIVNIKDITKPTTVVTYFMTNPHGLGKDGDLLFICDGSAGLKVYDASYPMLLSGHLIYTYPGIKAYDVIPVGDVLVLIGDDGLYQYNYSDVKNISLLSTISVAKVERAICLPPRPSGTPPGAGGEIPASNTHSTLPCLRQGRCREAAEGFFSFILNYQL